MKNTLFKNTPIPTPQKSSFDLSHEVKMTCQIGQLIPIMWYDVVPGDSFRIKNEVLVKFAPLLSPMLHRVDVYTHTFFVPYRLLFLAYASIQGDWESFITNDPEAQFGDNELPYLTINNTNKVLFSHKGLPAYMGLPNISAIPSVTQDIDINALPFLAYQKIYDDYYRDENLIPKITGHAGSGNPVPLRGGDRNGEIAAITTVRKRAYEKDYFKGALPTAYYGASSDVELDLDLAGVPTFQKTAGGMPIAGAAQIVGDELRDASSIRIEYSMTDAESGVAVLEIMELRRAQALTRYLEAENRGGHRYIEQLLGVWGVVGDNQELQYPKYLGGGRQAVQISSVLNQSQVVDPTTGANDGVGGVPVTIDPQSLETGRAIASGVNNSASGHFKEHGVVMTIMSVLPRTAYGGAQIEKYWRKVDRTDFFVPQLQNIGDQEILQSEIAYDATGVDADNVFGYAPRWAEYKFKNSLITGEFLTSLDYWHMGEIGDTSGAGPDLNQAFIECNFTEDKNLRVFANESSSDDHLYVQIYNDVQAIRPMQTFDVPK